GIAPGVRGRQTIEQIGKQAGSRGNGDDKVKTATEKFAANLIAAILRQRNMIAGAVIISAVASMVGYKYVPKSYKVQAIIGVQTQYFQSPLVRDFVAETWDSNEL